MARSMCMFIIIRLALTANLARKHDYGISNGWFSQARARRRQAKWIRISERAPCAADISGLPGRAAIPPLRRPFQTKLGAGAWSEKDHGPSLPSRRPGNLR